MIIDPWSRPSGWFELHRSHCPYGVKREVDDRSVRMGLGSGAVRMRPPRGASDRFRDVKLARSGPTIMRVVLPLELM